MDSIESKNQLLLTKEERMVELEWMNPGADYQKPLKSWKETTRNNVPPENGRLSPMKES